MVGLRGLDGGAMVRLSGGFGCHTCSLARQMLPPGARAASGDVFNFVDAATLVHEALVRLARSRGWV